MIERPRILFVDDEPVLLNLAQRFLTSAGYNVVTASSAAETWERLRAHGNNGFEVILLDGLEGGAIELGQEILARGFTGHLVCVSADDGIAREMMGEGRCTARCAFKPEFPKLVAFMKRLLSPAESATPCRP